MFGCLNVLIVTCLFYFVVSGWMVNLFVYCVLLFVFFVLTGVLFVDCDTLIVVVYLIVLFDLCGLVGGLDN